MGLKLRRYTGRLTGMEEIHFRRLSRSLGYITAEPGHYQLQGTYPGAVCLKYHWGYLYRCAIAKREALPDPYDTRRLGGSPSKDFTTRLTTTGAKGKGGSAAHEVMFATVQFLGNDRSLTRDMLVLDTRGGSCIDLNLDHPALLLHVPHFCSPPIMLCARSPPSLRR